MSSISGRQPYESNPWVLCLAPRPCAWLRLFCFPHAGAGPVAYRDWFKLMPPEIEVCGVRLPGRETRISEPPPRDLPTLIAELAEGLGPCLDGPFAMFGHSMGAIVAYELAHYLRDRGRPMPVHLFLSAHRAPHLAREGETYSDLDDAAFLAKLEELGGSSETVLRHAELMDLLLPVVRADFALCERYTPQSRRGLPCPITAMGGVQDPFVDREGLEGWREHTQSEFSLHLFPGGHFYPVADPAMVTEVLVRRLIPYLSQVP